MLHIRRARLYRGHYGKPLVSEHCEHAVVSVLPYLVSGWTCMQWHSAILQGGCLTQRCCVAPRLDFHMMCQALA